MMKSGIINIEDLAISKSLTLNDFLETNIGRESRVLSRGQVPSLFSLGKRVLYNHLFEVKLLFNNNKIARFLLSNAFLETWPERNDPKELQFRDECFDIIKRECGSYPPYYFDDGHIDVHFEPHNNVYSLVIEYHQL